MKIIDLTHTINEKMPVYPNTPQPYFSASQTFEKQGFCETMLHMVSHTGTHIDAPAHMIPHGHCLDNIPIEKFLGLSLILDVSKFQSDKIPKSFFESFQEKLEICRFIILKSHHDQFWGQEKYFYHYPVLSCNAANYLMGLPLLNGIGIDMISIDSEKNNNYPIHKIILGSGKIVIENLTNLDEIKGEFAFIFVFPLKYRNADGSPVRAIAFDIC